MMANFLRTLIIFLFLQSSTGTSPVIYSTPGSYSFTVPVGVARLTVKLWGGGGSGGGMDGGVPPLYGYAGGAGGFATGSLLVTPGQTVYVIVAGGGQNTGFGVNAVGGGGYGGGGSSTNRGGHAIGGGGGRSAIQLVSDTDAITAAGGGGGGSFHSSCGAVMVYGMSGGFGGGGAIGMTITSGNPYAGGGGTQTAGGLGGGQASGYPSAASAGSQYQGGSGPPGSWGTGGGGGYFGGGGGSTTSCNVYGGGGGSSYIGGCSSQFLAYSLAGQSGFSPNSASPSLPPRSTDPNYASGVGVGSIGTINGVAPVTGGNGLVWISFSNSSLPSSSDVWEECDDNAAAETLMTCRNGITVTPSKEFSFFVIGDFGEPNDRVKAVAASMASVAEALAPHFILTLGDNIYDYGCQSVDDPLFQTHWVDVFLRKYPSLHVPWMVALGNHDYYESPQAQIDFTAHASNPMGLWRCPSNNYRFCVDASGESIPPPMAEVEVMAVAETVAVAATMDGAPTGIRAAVVSPMVEFFCIDTNGCQDDVRGCRDYRTTGHLKYPTIRDDLRGHIAQLEADLKRSTAKWKVVYGHHPLYTKGRGHNVEAQTLKREYDFENALVRGGADVYFAGHEHVFQYHHAKGVHHFVGGATCRSHFFAGVDQNLPMDWYDVSNRFGFIAVHVSEERLLVQFISAEDNSIIKDVIITK